MGTSSGSSLVALETQKLGQVQQTQHQGLMSR